MRKIINGNALKKLLGFGQTFKPAPEMDRHYYIEGESLSEEREFFDAKSNTKKIIACVIFSFFAVIIQEAFFNDLRVLGAKADLAFVVVLIIASLSEMRFAMIYGLCTGLFMDVVYGRYLGLYGLLFMYAAVIIAVATVPKIKGRYLYMLGTGSAVLLVHALSESFLARLLTVYSTGHTVLYYDFWGHFAGRILPELVYNVVVFGALAFPVTLLWKRLSSIRRGS